MGNKKKNSFKTVAFIFFGTLITSIFIYIMSEVFLRSVAIILGLFLLATIILIGIIFDIIGIAAATANESALNARAAKKVSGAKEAVFLVKNADRVASFCNDVVGDISGTISGAIGTAIIYKVLTVHPGLDKLLLTSLMAGIVAAITVTGKAYAKSYAIVNATHIIFRVGKFVKKVNNIFRVRIYKRSR